MRVLYDHQIFQAQEFGGISRYFTELYRNTDPGEAEIALLRCDNQHLLSLPGMRSRVRPHFGEIDTWPWGLKFRGKRRLYEAVRKVTRRPSLDALNRRYAIARLRSSDYDLFHPTYYDPFFLGVLGARPFVLTVFDMIHEFFPEDFPDEDPIREWKQILCRRAARIIAISKTTKDDLVARYRIDPEKIDVVHLGVSVTPGQPTGFPAAELPRKYILFTGKRHGYKNFSFFVTAIADILRQDEMLKLVCTGHPFTAAENSLLRELGLTRDVVHFKPIDRNLGSLYENAEMFVFPSLYEGFGMPVLEAFACGCPAVLSDTLAMREVAAEAALFFDPRNASEIASAVSSVLHNKALRKNLVELGHRRAARFSWTKTSSETKNVYLRALNGAVATA